MTNKSKVINGVQHKQCSNCRRYKPIDAFNKMKDGKFGVMGECRVCASRRTKQYVREHPECLERYNARKRERYKNEPDFRVLVKERDRKRRETNPEYYKEWVEQNSDYHKEYQRKWRRTHPGYYDKYRMKKVE